MWHHSNCEEYLNNELSHLGQNLWETKVFPQLKTGAYSSILSVADQLQHRDRSHAILGFDFMLDQDLNVWLIEVNSSPAMDYSTKVTTELCPCVLKDTLKIILDCDNGRDAGSGHVGDWELIKL